MVIRVQNDSKPNEEWDPPCQCVEENNEIQTKRIQNFDKNRHDIAFRKVDLNNTQNSCRTITVYPQADSDVHTEPNFDKSINVNTQKATVRNIDLEENPNIFLLRIKKRCENDEGKYNIDLEFRTPRPWSTKPTDNERPLPFSPINSKTTENQNEDKKDKGEKRQKQKTKKKGKKRK